MYEYDYYNGEHFVTFDIIEVREEKKITLAITNNGRISQDTFDLLEDKNGLYFEYGLYQEKIYIMDFERR